MWLLVWFTTFLGCSLLGPLSQLAKLYLDETVSLQHNKIRITTLARPTTMYCIISYN